MLWPDDCDYVVQKHGVGGAGVGLPTTFTKFSLQS